MISSGKLPVILSLVMVVLFGGLSIWLKKSENGAFLFTGLLTAAMFAAFLAAAYRALFYKVLIGREGFYYQSHPGNGRYYDYRELSKAWISAGKDISGTKSEFCSFETPDGQVIRFPFYYADRKAVRYLVKRTAEEAEYREATKQEYRIDGKAYGKSQMVITGVLLVVFIVFTVSLIPQEPLLYWPGLWGIVMLLAALVLLIVRYFCFQVQIGEKGFYFQTTPFNGRHYSYSQIVSCREIEKVHRRRSVYHRGRGRPRTHYFYFVFTDTDGKTRKFQFEKPIYAHEVEMLKERIETSA